MEQPATVVLEAADDATHIARSFADVAEHPYVSCTARQVPGSACTTDTTVVFAAAAGGVDTHTSIVEGDMADDSAEPRCQAFAVRTPDQAPTTCYTPFSFSQPELASD